MDSEKITLEETREYDIYVSMEELEELERELEKSWQPAEDLDYWNDEQYKEESNE